MEINRYLMTAQAIVRRAHGGDDPVRKHIASAHFYATEEDARRIAQMFNLGTYGPTLQVDILDDPLANPTTVSDSQCPASKT